MQLKYTIGSCIAPSTLQTFNNAKFSKYMYFSHHSVRDCQYSIKKQNCLFYRYYFDKCSSALGEIVPKPKILSRNTRRANPLTCYHVNIERTCTQGRSQSFLVRTGHLWNQLPSSCFPAQYNLDSFKRRVNKFLKFK